MSMMSTCGIQYSENVGDFYNCYNNSTVDGSTMVLGSKTFTHADFTFENTTQSEWRPLFSYYFGQCVTSNNIDTLEEGQFLKIYLNKSMDYKIWLHDPDFFYLSLNPESVPKLELKYDPLRHIKNKFKNRKYFSVLNYIHQQKHTTINRPQESIVKLQSKCLRLKVLCLSTRLSLI